MKSIPWLALVACLMPFPAIADEAREPDTYRELVRYRSQQFGAAATFNLSTGQFLQDFLLDASSPYSGLNDTPVITNELWWPSFVAALPPVNGNAFESALHAVQRRTGLTKARPGPHPGPDVDVVVGQGSVRDYRTTHAAANALKAGVDARILWKARDMNGSLTTVAAGYAVALQILHDQIRRYDPADYGRLAIKKDVFDRYMAQQWPERVSEYDRRYLADLLRQALNQPPAGNELPAAFRVARAAAAYSDADPDAILCHGNAPREGQPKDQMAIQRDRLCFVAATDRAVQAWYRRKLRSEVSSPHHASHAHGSHLMHWIGTVLLLIDFAAFVETAEAFVADDLAADGLIEESDAEFAAQRSNRLACRIKP